MTRCLNPVHPRVVQIPSLDHKLREPPGDGASFSEGFAFPAKRGKTSNQLAPSEPEEKDGDVDGGVR